MLEEKKLCSFVSKSELVWDHSDGEEMQTSRYDMNDAVEAIF